MVNFRYKYMYEMNIGFIPVAGAGYAIKKYYIFMDEELKVQIGPVLPY